MKRRSKKSYYDISFDTLVDESVVIVAVLVIVVTALFYLLWLAGEDDVYEHYSERKAAVESFNALSLEDRQTISKAASWSGPSMDKETFLLSIKEPSNPDEVWLSGLLIALAIDLTIMSMALAISCMKEKRSDYFLADLPFHTFYGWWLFFSMFAAWPFLLISAIRMWLYFSPSRKAERAEVDRQAEIEISDEQAYTIAQSPEIRRQKVARKAYIDYRVKGSHEAQQKLIEAAEERIEGLSRTIKNYGKNLQEAQRNLGEAKAELKRLTEERSNAKVTRTQAKAEWDIIAEMRGVAKITAHQGRGKRPDKIQILVKVRVPYRMHVYDFGDYQITLCGDTYKCERVRSGIRVDHSNTRPSYNESSGFCFGHRRETIREYLEQGKTIEAITLMIDCLHSVNDGDEIYIPDCFRKVVTVERAKKRLRRQAKGGGN